MNGAVALASPGLHADLSGPNRTILEIQRPDGAIPWFEDGPWDPWNHAECLMALGAMGELDAVRRGLDFLQASQCADGSWLGEYGNALPVSVRQGKIARCPAQAVKDANFTAYPAIAVWRQLLLSRDDGEARRRWTMVRCAIEFVLRLQHPFGDISWCLEAVGTGIDDSLIAGNASIYASLGCAIALAEHLGERVEPWKAARRRLRHAILCRPDRFNRRAGHPTAFAMDWYYPVLAGVTRQAAGYARLESGAARFVRAGLGCRCVASEPWVTIAESCELALTLMRLGNFTRAAAILAWQDAHRDLDGAYWMGWQYAEARFWPCEKTAWTQAAAILAHDALRGETAASSVLISG